MRHGAYRGELQMAVQMFVNIDGIKGESVDSDHKDWIDIQSWTWGMTQSGNAHQGTGAGTGQVSVRDVSFTKFVDKSTPILAKFCCSGKHFGKAQLVVCKAGNTKVPYLTITMAEGLISSCSHGGAAHDERMVETVSLHFRSFHILHTLQNSDGSKGASIPAGWDIAAATEYSP
jgi:type VI secretion system secreted protein Hcp